MLRAAGGANVTGRIDIMIAAGIFSVLIVVVWFATAPPENDVGAVVVHGLIGIPLAIIALLLVWLVYFAFT